jgi:thioredoxin 1
MPTTTLPDITDATFDETITGAEVPVLVDFWATWCGPCTLVEPILAEIAEQRSDLRIVRLDVDANPRAVQRYGVMSMPTLMLFRGGEPVLRMVGARGRSHLLAEIDGAL